MSHVDATVLRALELLDYLSLQRDGQRLKNIAAAIGWPASTTHRLLKTLATKGYVQQSHSDQTYRLGWKVVSLARSREAELRHEARSYTPGTFDGVGEGLAGSSPVTGKGSGSVPRQTDGTDAGNDN